MIVVLWLLELWLNDELDGKGRHCSCYGGRKEEGREGIRGAER